ncbi:MAG: DUF3108 domain-containing protein [Bacteroidota bacterium]
MPNLWIPLRLLLMAGLWFPAFLSVPARSQCAFSKQALSDGEDISYEISYNWGPIWVTAGVVTFKTGLELRKEKPVWHLISTGRTYQAYDFIFKVRDAYETWIDTASLQTIEFRRYIFEGGYHLQNRSWYDYGRRRIFSTTKINDEPLVADTLRMINCTYDMLSAVYYVRSLDLTSLASKDTIPVFVAIDDSVYRIDIRFLGKEIVEHPGGSYYPCNKFSAAMVEGTIFTKGQKAFVWVSDDPNKVPVYIEAKILVGSVKAYLKEAKGLRYPLATVNLKK